jgi:acetyltransferase-like isoleucine patch superfamily enzyme
MIKSIGKHTFGHNRIEILYGKSYGGGELTIGSFTSIGDGVTIFLGGNHNTHWVSCFPFGHSAQDVFSYHGLGHPATNGDVVIGNDVWIANGVTIMSGITVGDGAVLACNSHIIESIPPYTIFGGNPAKTIRPRFDTKTIERLLTLEWWLKSDAWINKHLHLLCSNKIEEFLQVAELSEGQ